MVNQKSQLKKYLDQKDKGTAESLGCNYREVIAVLRPLAQCCQNPPTIEKGHMAACEGFSAYATGLGQKGHTKSKKGGRSGLQKGDEKERKRKQKKKTVN